MVLSIISVNLPCVLSGASKTLTKDPSFHENTSVEVSRIRTHSRNSSDGKERRSKHSSKEQQNPMENPRLGQPSDNAYYVTASNFTSQDVEEFKKLAQKNSPKAHSECSSSSHISAPDPPHLNMSPSDYIQRNYRSRSQSNKSSSTYKSDLTETEIKEPKNLKEAIAYDDPGPFKIDLTEEQTNQSSDISQNKPEPRKLTNKYKPSDKASRKQKKEASEKAFIESLPPVNKVSDDFLKELYSDAKSDTVDSKVEVSSERSYDADEIRHDSCDSYKEYKNYSNIRRLESINTEVKEDAILHDILSSETELTNGTEATGGYLDQNSVDHLKGHYKEESSLTDNTDIIEAFGERIDLNDNGDMNKKTESKEPAKPPASGELNINKNLEVKDQQQKSEEQYDKQPSPLTESNLKQLNEELNSIPGHIEEKISVDVADSAVKREKKTSPKRKSERRRQSKDHLKPDFSPPKSEPLKPELSPAKADKIDTFQYNAERLTNHRLSLPNNSLGSKPQTVQGTHRQSMPNILESTPELTNQISSSYDLPERFHEIYDGKPIDEGNDAEDGDTINEEDVPVVDNEHRQSVGNSLMSGRGWSSSFDSELNDTIEPLSPPRTDNAMPITTRPKGKHDSLLYSFLSKLLMLLTHTWNT